MKNIKIYNSASKELVDFTPDDENNVKMYCCGPTVYSYAHIGNLRAAVFADIVFRVMIDRYGFDNVEFARNITDIDDKIINKAKSNFVDYKQISTIYEDIYKEDVSSINCLSPTHQPRATEYVDEMIEDIKSMLFTGDAYVSGDHIYYNVKNKFKNTFIDVSVDDNNFTGERNKFENKINKEDFVLWKPSLDGDPSWFIDLKPLNDWENNGRMGWHTECMSMIHSLFGNSESEYIIDLHLGGKDLKFPHHENECAQSYSAHKRELSKYWAHNGFITFEGEKGSKTLNNLPSLSHFYKSDFNLEVIRFFLLSSNYASDLSYSEEKMKECKSVMDSFYQNSNLLQDYDILNIDNEFLDHMYNNFDTVMAIKRLKEILKEYNISKDITILEKLFSSLNFIGLGLCKYDEWWKIDTNSDIEVLIKQRQIFRDSKEWQKADEIRVKLLNEIGVTLVDNPETGETTWKRG